MTTAERIAKLLTSTPEALGIFGAVLFDPEFQPLGAAIGSIGLEATVTACETGALSPELAETFRECGWSVAHLTDLKTFERLALGAALEARRLKNPAGKIDFQWWKQVCDVSITTVADRVPAVVAVETVQKLLDKWRVYVKAGG